MLDILGFLFKHLKLKAPIILAVLVGIALTVTYFQFNLNAQQEKCIDELKKDLTNAQKIITTQSEIQKSQQTLIDRQQKDLEDLETKYYQDFNHLKGDLNRLIDHLLPPIQPGGGRPGNTNPQ